MSDVKLDPALCRDVAVMLTGAVKLVGGLAIHISTTHCIIIADQLTAAADLAEAMAQRSIAASPVSIGTDDTAIIDRALAHYSRDYKGAPHEDIARIRFALSGRQPS